MIALRFAPLLLIALTGCTPLSYQSVNLNADKGDIQTSGYINKEVSEGVHVIEVRHDSRTAFLLQKQTILDELTSLWHRRAKELCAKGYQGEPEVVRPADARTDEFYCTLQVCQQYPLVSGIAYCKSVYEL